MHRHFTLSLFLLSSLGAAACGGGQDAGPPADPAVVAEAKQVWDTRCATCHGPQGAGNGAAAAALNPKPRSFTDASWQKGVTDEHISKVIVEGGAAVNLSANMAANPDLAAKPEVVKQLVKMVRSFAG
jgi:mono/diheme cytochrome c family protein